MRNVVTFECSEDETGCTVHYLLDFVEEIFGEFQLIESYNSLTVRVLEMLPKSSWPQSEVRYFLMEPIRLIENRHTDKLCLQFSLMERDESNMTPRFLAESDK